MDETGLFYRALPTRTVAVQGEEARGGKKAKDRITIDACSATGEKLKTLIASEEHHILSQQKSMDDQSSIPTVTGQVNNFLFVDNCAAHPDVMCSNVKLISCPQTLHLNFSLVMQELFKQSNYTTISVSCVKKWIWKLRKMRLFLSWRMCYTIQG